MKFLCKHGVESVMWSVIEMAGYKSGQSVVVHVQYMQFSVQYSHKPYTFKRIINCKGNYWHWFSMLWG
jgi:hypothetical protein